MAIIFEDLVIDRVLEGVFRDKNANVIGALSEVQNFSINSTSETKDKTDSKGVLIKRFFQSKAVELSAENAVFSLSLLALQSGTEKVVGAAGATIRLPMIKTYAKTASPIALPFTPIDGTLSVTGLKSTGVPDTSLVYTLGNAASDGVYAVSVAGGVTSVALPTDAVDRVQIQFMYESENGVKVLNSADKFPAECELTLSVLVCDACDKEVLRHAYIVFPAFQMSPDFDLTLDTDSAHPFSGTAAVDYCSADKTLFYIAISEDDIEE